MDDVALDVLSKLSLPNVRLIPLADFEDEELRRVKHDRTVAEYCWTCSPCLPLFVLNHNPDIDLITYVDADLFFFCDPSPIFDEFGECSILIVEHRLVQRLQYLLVNGIYNVEWLSFRRDKNGLASLAWWREKCIEWCYARLEDGKLGDQKYLDDWPRRFDGVHVLQHVGAGVAPWNFSQYEISTKDGQILVNGTPLIFYHFHGLRWFVDDRYYFMAPIYTGDKAVPMLIYEPYVAALRDARRLVLGVCPQFDYGIEKTEKYWRHAAKEMLKAMVPTPVKSVINNYLARPKRLGH